MSTTASRQQPPWQAPPGVASRLKVYNSLTRTKNSFVPLDPRGREVTWYCCGPTVYDAGHLGHARNYISTDILRRIMRDYFRFDVLFVMNITDVDDKIIVRARQEHFLAEFKKNHDSVSDPEVLKTTLLAFNAYAYKNLPRLGEDPQPESYEQDSEKAYAPVIEGGTISGQGTPGDNEAKIKMHLKTLSSASKALIAARKGPSSMTAGEFYGLTGEILQPYLDALYASSINPEEYTIFTKLTQHWERQFNQDLRDLNCLPPDILTRVSEYIVENVSFVERIVNNGFAYVTEDGSVYFDIKAFEAAGHNYARLEPWNRNDKELLADGEGSLTKKTGVEKRSDADFALWKSSKPGEPSWPSPWGRGRPGWHIECSAMCSKVLGSTIDIHSGGIDLAFPHHDNELAQAEAYWTKNTTKSSHSNGHSHQWVNYFLHMGHLNISGSKMSKSLKNFTTIRTALEKKQWTARGLRIVFLLGGWKERIEVTDDVALGAKAWEAAVNKFFINVTALTAEEQGEADSDKLVPQPYVEEEYQLWAQLREAKAKVDEALCDSFNTPAAMAVIADIISKANIYISSNQKSNTGLSAVKGIARWVTWMLDIFGLDASTSGAGGGDRIGWGSATVGSNSLSKDDIEKRYLAPFSAFRDRMHKLALSQPGTPLSQEILRILDATSTGVPPTAPSNLSDNQSTALRYVRPISAFRDKMRHFAMANTKAAPAIAKSILQDCDRVRDEELANLGIYLDDRTDAATGAQLPALIKFVPKEQLIADREERVAKAAEIVRKKEEARLERERIEREKEEKGRLSHREIFKTNDYSEWDEDGIPVKDKEGVEITKSKAKKLRKDWERQKRAHEEWVKKQGSA